MNFAEAMHLVVKGKAVYSGFVGGTVVHMPNIRKTMFVPRITNDKPIALITQFVATGVATGATDWVLSGITPNGKGMTA
jgi:hypothetical protein